MNDEKDVRIYRLKIVYDHANKEILHLSESYDNDGRVLITIEDQDILVPDEMAKILNSLEHDTLGIT